MTASILVKLFYRSKDLIVKALENFSQSLSPASQVPKKDNRKIHFYSQSESLLSNISYIGILEGYVLPIYQQRAMINSEQMLLVLDLLLLLSYFTVGSTGILRFFILWNFIF